MNEKPPFAVAVSPSGARRTQADHPGLPVSPAEIAQTAADCLDAGASMLHLHVRRPDLRHSLEVEDYQTALQAVRNQVGQRMLIQVTTEAAGRYAPDQQIQLVKTLKPEAASIALRELAGPEAELSQAADFFHWMYREHVVPQFILYSKNEVGRYLEFLQRGVIPAERHWVLFVLGRYDQVNESTPSQLLSFLEAWRSQGTVPWMICAFGRQEAACMATALALGGHARVGFENNLNLPDGSRAANNRQLVEVVVQIARFLGTPLADADTIREWFE